MCKSGNMTEVMQLLRATWDVKLGAILLCIKLRLLCQGLGPYI